MRLLLLRRNLNLCLLFTVFFSFWIGPNVASAQNAQATRSFNKAENFKKQGRYKDAVTAYQQAITYDPNQAIYYFQLGMTYLSAKRVDNAIAQFEKATQVRKDYMSAYAILTKLYLRKNSYKNAVRTYNSSYKYEADDRRKLEYKLNIIRLLDKNKVLHTAGPHVNDALALSPKNVTANYYNARIQNLKKNYSGASNSALLAIQNSPTSSPESNAKYYYELAYALFHSKQYAKANKVMPKANYGIYKSKIRKMTPNYYYRLASLYFEVNEYKRAKSMNSKALEIQSSYAPAINLQKKLSTLKSNSSSSTGTINAQKQKIANEPNINTKIQLYAKLCELQYLLGDYKGAIESADQVLKIQPYKYTVKYFKARSIYELGNLTEAITELEKLLKITTVDPTSRTKYYLILGLFYKEKHLNSKAKYAFKKVRSGNFRYLAKYELESM